MREAKESTRAPACSGARPRAPEAPLAPAAPLRIKFPLKKLASTEEEEGLDEVRVRVIPRRADLAKRLLGCGRKWSPGRDAVRELNEERVREDGLEGGK